MASPTLETFCCIVSNETGPSLAMVTKLHAVPYNIVSLVFAVFGFAGALYQIQRQSRRAAVRPGRRNPSLILTRGNDIIKWMAVADAGASLGIITRTLAWLFEDVVVLDELGNSVSSKVFCALSSAVVHYFYSATFMWTLLYAVDMVLVLREKRTRPALYHTVSWLLPAVLCIAGLSILYLPSLSCHERNVSYVRFLPNYLFTYIPMAAVMVANPALYLFGFRKVESLYKGSGRYSHHEHRVTDTLRTKFLCINLVFYVCWTPNLVNGFLLWTSDRLPVNVIKAVWFIMAMVNPLQAVFNTLVYRSWEEPLWQSRVPSTTSRPDSSTSSLDRALINGHAEETTPLITKPAHKWLQSLQQGFQGMFYCKS